MYDAFVVLASQLCRKEAVDRKGAAMACCSLLLALPGAILSAIGLDDASGLVSEVTGYAESGIEAADVVAGAVEVTDIVAEDLTDLSNVVAEGAEQIAEQIAEQSTSAEGWGMATGDQVVPMTTGASEATSDVYWMMRQGGSSTNTRPNANELVPFTLRDVAQGVESAPRGAQMAWMRGAEDLYELSGASSGASRDRDE